MSEVLHEELPVAEQRIRTKSYLCVGAAKILLDAAKACKCPGLARQSFLWHHDRALTEPLEDTMWRLVEGMDDARSVIVSATHSIFRFLEAGGHVLCKDQLLRLVAVSICLNSKYWDDFELGRRTNNKIAFKTGIPRDEIGGMELAFLQRLDWNLGMSEEDFQSCEARIEARAEAWYGEQETKRQSCSPYSATDVTDVAHELAERLKQL